jgi:hypothetical protein
MAMPTYKPTETTPPTPPTKTVPDQGHPNAADKPFHERIGGGATDKRPVHKDDNRRLEGEDA